MDSKTAAVYISSAIFIRMHIRNIFLNRNNDNITAAVKTVVMAKLSLYD